VSSEYQPEPYWTERLSTYFDLRGVGHISYSVGYNRWAYVRKSTVLRAQLRGIPRPFRALDVGSGTGWVVRQLLELGGEVEGCDLTAIAVERLETTIPDGTFFQAAIGSEPIPRPDASYDVVTALDVAYHITDDTAWRDAIAEIARVLRPGGVFIVTDRFADDEVFTEAHVKTRSRREWDKEAARKGLRVTRVDPVTSWLQRSREESVMRRLPDRLRGPIEYVLEYVAPREPNLRSVVFTKT